MQCCSMLQADLTADKLQIFIHTFDQASVINVIASRAGKRFLLAEKASKPDIQPSPPSQVLDRVRALLPTLQNANEQLEQRLQSLPAGSCDIERLEDAAGPHIEMDLACGLFEQASDRSTYRPAPASESQSSSSDGSVSDSNGQSESKDVQRHGAVCPTTSPRRKLKPNITVLEGVKKHPHSAKRRQSKRKPL